MPNLLGDLTVSDARNEELASLLANLLGLSTRQVNRVLKNSHGNSLLRTAFGEAWADGIGSLRSSVAREWGLASEIAVITNKRAQGVGRRLNRAHGRTLVRNLFEDSWPTPTTRSTPRTTRTETAPKVKAPSGYRILEAIGGGGMAEAFRGIEESTGDPVFIKRVRGTSEDVSALNREIQIYDRLDRKQATCMMAVRGIDRIDDWVYLVTDLADGGDLRTYLEANQPLSHKQVHKIASDVAQALAALHSHGVVHRDLKPGNILLHQRKWRLTDFGISKNLGRLQTARTMRGRGTEGFAAPEQWNQVEARPSADVFSYGQVLRRLVGVGDSPWQSLIDDCTRSDPDARPAMSEVVARLRSLSPT